MRLGQYLYAQLHHILNEYSLPLVVSYPDPPPKRRGGSDEFSTASHIGELLLWVLLKAKPLKLLAGLQQIGGVLSRPVKV